jgi:tape measure domain-containing protein
VARSSIELIVNASNAINPLKRVAAETRKLDGAVRDANGRLRDAKGRFVGVGAGANQATGGLRNFNNGLGSIKKAIGGIGLTVLTKQIVGAAASFNSLQLRLKLLTQQYGETEQAQEIIARSAKKFGLSNREAAQGVTDIFARLRPLGVSLKDIESTFVGFNTVAKLSGVEAQQASAAFTQLAQALGSGRLQGDEFRSIAEQIPGLLTAVSEVTGVAQGELKEYASQGLITSEIVIAALKKAEKEGGGAIAQIVEESDTQKFKNFQNAVDDLSIAVGNGLLPTLIPLIEKVTAVANGIASLPKPIVNTTVKIALAVTQILLINKAFKVLAGLKAGVFATFTSAASGAAAAGTAAKVANPFLLKTKALMLGLAKIGFITLGINIVVNGLEKLAEVEARFKALEQDGTEKFAASVGGSALSKSEIQKLLDQNAAETKRRQQELKDIRFPGLTAQDEIARGALEQLRQRRAKLESMARKTQFATAEEREAANAKALQDRFKLSLKDLEGDGKGKGKGRTKVDPAMQAQKNALIQLQALRDEVEVRKARNEEEARMIELQHQTRKIEEQRVLIGDVLADQLIQETRERFTVNELQLFKQKKDQEIADQQQKNAEDLKKAQEAEAERIKELAQRYQGIADTIANGVVGALKGAVMGTQTLAESASNLLNNLANDLLMVAKNMLFFGSLGGGLSKGSGLLGNLFSGFLADGGTATGGRSFIVGERGPELFTPGRTGSVTPNSALGGSNIVVNVDASGSSVEGDSDQAGQLGKMLGAAVQAELIKQKRPGGLLA